MSLILDALKKSEAERQRQNGPTLLEVRITQPRRRYPPWVIAVGALLALNMLLLLAFVLHRPASAPAQTSTTPMAPPAAVSAPVASVPAATSSGVASSGPASPGLTPNGMTSVTPNAQAPVLDASAPVISVNGTMPPAARNFPLPEASGDGQDSGGNPADDEPAVPPGGNAASPARDSGGHYSDLPNFNDLGGDLPELRLDLHVYAEHSRDRYAMINMHRVREGDALPEGPRVLAITREGVALDYKGQQFMLHPQ
jgi:general secretion pathway protein B